MLKNPPMALLSARIPSRAYLNNFDCKKIRVKFVFGSIISNVIHRRLFVKAH